MEDAVGFVTDSVAANDTDVDSSLDLSSVTLASGPSNGSASYAGAGRFNYTPNANTTGLDSFTYTVDDAEGAVSNTATVTVNVTPANDPPVAVADAGVGFELAEDAVGFVTGDVTANDIDVDDGIDASSAVVTAGAGNGSVSTNGDGTFTYTPDADFHGSDAFSYAVDDGAGAISSATTVTLVVTPLKRSADGGRPHADGRPRRGRNHRRRPTE